MDGNSMDQTINTRPGGFWIRFLAAVIDGIIIAIPCAIVNGIFKGVTGLVNPSGTNTAFAAFAFTVSLLIGILISLAYHAYYYQSTGSTIGKKLFMLKVIDNHTGNLLTFKQVFLREVIGKFLSGITFMIGYIMGGVRHDKRALHDLVADSRVIETLHVHR
jgi:uncharacterized RDD family membrane protein YckC